MFGTRNDLELLNVFDWDAVMNDDDWRADTLALYYFHTVIMCVLDQNGWSINGCSFSERGLNTMLVVKATHDGIPLVAFVTERYPTGCVRAFCRMYLMDRVKWHSDKFRKT